MMAKFKVIALSSLDPDGHDTAGEPDLMYPDALKVAREFKAQGIAFRVPPLEVLAEEQRQTFSELGALL